MCGGAEVDKIKSQVSVGEKKKREREKKKNQQHMLQLRRGTPAKVMV